MIGVFLDGVRVSMIGVAFGVLSSATTAVHAVVIKKSLDLLGGSALHLGWYSNLLSSALIAIIIVAAGEVPDVLQLLSGRASDIHTFLTGSLITVCKFLNGSVYIMLKVYLLGGIWFPHVHREPPVDKSNITHYTHDLVSCSWRCRVFPGCMDISRRHHDVSPDAFLLE